MALEEKIYAAFQHPEIQLTSNLNITMQEEHIPQVTVTHG
jgi:hypothetical protein